MRDGYYISAYANISELGHLLCTVTRHDNCIALWKKTGRQVVLIHYWELERLTGMKKHALAFYNTEQCKNVLNKLLMPFNITLNDIIEIWGIPELQENNEYLSHDCFCEYSFHTISHVFSALLSDSTIYQNEKILAMSVDGGSDIVMNKIYNVAENIEGSKYQFMGLYSDRKENMLQPFPVYSPAQIWMMLSFHYDMQEGSLMALAGASESIVYIEPEDILFPSKINKEQYDISYQKIMDLISYVDNLTKEDTGRKFNGFDQRFTEEENKISMVMKIVQGMSQHIMERNIEYAIKRFAINPTETYLCMAGGFALNCPCNSHLMKKYGFKGFLSIPCVSDTGMALGIGLYAFYKLSNDEFDFKLENAFYGDTDDLDSFLSEREYERYIENVNEFNPEQAAKDIQNEPIIWFDGRAEIGPRALGSRSILGDPQNVITKKRLNEIKQRQWWRPVAPVIIEEDATEWFEDCYTTPYMLHTFTLKEEKIKRVPAIAHYDNSARVQTIGKVEGRLRKVLEAFYKQTGVPIICNTSLNDKGEPIINSIPEAMNFALRKNIRIIYINGKRITIRNHKLYNAISPLKRPLDFFVWKSEQERQFLIKQFSPYNIPEDDLWIIVHYNLYNFEQINLKDKLTARILTIKAKQMEQYFKENPIREGEKTAYYKIYKLLINERRNTNG